MENSNSISLRESALQKTIMLGGCGRSGTSILGKLLATANAVEYSYDPPMLHHALFVSDISEEARRHLMAVYLYDECLLEQSIGRKLNLRDGDMTFAGHVMTEDEWREKWRLAGDRNTAESVASNKRMICKITDVWAVADMVQRFVSDGHLLFIFREPEAVINSLVKKAWYTDEALTSEDNGHTPMTYHRNFEDKLIPGWVPKGKESYFLSLSPVNRYGWYYLKSNEAILNSRAHLFSYEALVQKPENTAKRIFASLGLENGEKTSVVLDAIKPQPSTSQKRPEGLDEKLWHQCQVVYRELLAF